MRRTKRKKVRKVTQLRNDHIIDFFCRAPFPEDDLDFTRDQDIGKEVDFNRDSNSSKDP